MKKRLTTITLAAIFATGCGASDDADSAGDSIPLVNNESGSAQKGDAAMTTISGELGYRERIALIPGGTATITLSDTSLQDIAAIVIAETTIDLGDQQIPIPFELVADVSGLDERSTYSVRATITGPGDDLQWTTDAANQIDITETGIDLGMVMLVRAGGAATSPGDGSTSPLVGEWNVIQIGGTPILDDAPATLVFQDDGTLGGNSGCNSFSSTYSIVGDRVLLESEVAATLMACDPATSAQESALFAVVGDLATFEISGDGSLTVTSGDGSSIVAER